MFLTGMKPLPKAILLGAAVVALVFGAKAAMQLDVVAKYTAPKPTIATSVPDKIDIPTTGVAGNTTAIGGPVLAGMKTIRVKTLPWNGMAGALYAQAGGLYKARGLNVEFVREDDYSKMMADMAAFAKDSSQGVHFTIIMADGFPAFKIGADAAIKAAGAASTVRNVAGIGYSRGEDKCIVADGVDPRGSLIAGVLGDGDINICIKFAADNGIPVNSDPKVYNRGAMNFVGVPGFTDADQKFIASAMKDFKGGACVDLRDSESGKQVNVCVNGTATWTPGDANVFAEFKKMGKSIRVLASTKEYDTQMSAGVIGNAQWMAQNRDVVNAFLAATLEGGDKVRSDPAALMIASTLQAKVIGEQDPTYWAAMFRGVQETGPNGKIINLGGSTANGLADAARLFGLNGSDNLYKKVYTVYGNIAVKYFPDVMPGGLVKYEDAVDTSYLQDLLKAAKGPVTPNLPSYAAATTQTFASKTVAIEFETGKATFTPKAMAALNDVLDQAAVTSLSVQINGHTDNVGSPTSNLELSKARAEAVKKFLMTNAPTSFPAERVVTRGYGDTMPIGTNAQNRRVEILLRK
jgi:outer membrane protein OmpA-like peptidoglycan-associated protein/ABC-type nitrate/sulfonate/bicarbonate transport system substrate-binding protein